MNCTTLATGSLSRPFSPNEPPLFLDNKPTNLNTPQWMPSAVSSLNSQPIAIGLTKAGRVQASGGVGGSDTALSPNQHIAGLAAAPESANTFDDVLRERDSGSEFLDAQDSQTSEDLALEDSCERMSPGGPKNSVREEQVEMESEEVVQTSVSTLGGSGICVGPHDFEMLRLVGQGAFGKVFQVMHKKSGGIYAMKVMKKSYILEMQHSEYVLSERNLLTGVQHPYIVTLRSSFQTPSKLYLVLDFINGGHLFFNLYREGTFNEPTARLYAAEIVLAISYLHSRGIMHRDLKPENVLLDSDGHIRLTDFGLAKGNMSDKDAAMGGDGGRTNSFIGTMEYMAPEIIKGLGHGKSVDWWSVGILLYEMLCGVPPFRNKSRSALQREICEGKVKYPKFMSASAQSVLKALLTRDETKRLGCGPDGAEEIKRHPFFQAINWAKLERREVESVFKPSVSGKTCVANFDASLTKLKPVDSPCASPCGTPSAGSGMGNMFKGFSYVAPHFLEDYSSLIGGAIGDLATAAATTLPSRAPPSQHSPIPTTSSSSINSNGKGCGNCLAAVQGPSAPHTAFPKDPAALNFSKDVPSADPLAAAAAVHMTATVNKLATAGKLVQGASFSDHLVSGSYGSGVAHSGGNATTSGGGGSKNSSRRRKGERGLLSQGLAAAASG